MLTVSSNQYLVKMKRLLVYLTLIILPAGIRAQKPAENLPGGRTSTAVTIFTTAQNSNLRLSDQGNALFEPYSQPPENEISIFIDDRLHFQQILGIGGALTDASAETFYKLSKKNQDELLIAYFDKDRGIGYTLARTNIHSCDFSSDSYTYVREGDRLLESFSIDHDKKYRIPFIRSAIQASGGVLCLYASPWSPPAFMKSSNSMLHGGKLNMVYAQSWANYYVKFIKAYEKEGIPIWGISIQNEPMATQRWESCIYSAEDERDFLKKYLGPTMHKQGLGTKKIIVWDHNRDLMTHRANVIFQDKEASKYAWGLGFHWYENWSGGEPMFENVEAVNRSFPDKNLLFTEGCVERFSPDGLQRWSNGERYGNAMIQDFNNGSVGWTDWNILLDEHGGPNHAQNFCFAPVHGDTRTDQLIFTPSYYYIGHFSKFVRPGAHRIGASSSRSNLMTTAFKNKDGRIVTIVMNKSDAPVKYNLCFMGKAARVTIPEHAIQTLVLE